MYNQQHQYTSFNTKNLHSGASDVGLELGNAAADNTGILSGQSGASHWQFQQRELSRRPQQDTLLSGYNLPQAPLARMFESQGSLTLPTPFNANRYTHHCSETGPHDSMHLDVPSGDGQQTRSRSDFGITLPQINIPNHHSPQSSTSSSLLPRNDPAATPRTLPDAGEYLRHQLGWAQDTPVNLASLPDQPSGQKPLYTLPTLTKLAIYGSRGKKATLEGIYKAIEDRFEWYKNDKSNAWKRSIRHTLSLQKVFKNIPRPLSKSGRGSYWELDITQGEGYKRDRKRGKKGAPAPEVIEAETARQIGSTEEIILSSVCPKSPGQQDRNIGPQRPTRRATSLSRVSPYPVGEHSRAPFLAWAPHRSANAGHTEIVTRVGYDGAWHAQQPSTSTTHHSANPYQYSASLVTGGDFGGPVFPSPFVAGSSMQVLPPLIVPGGRYHAFDERKMYESQLWQGRRDDGQDRDR